MRTRAYSSSRVLGSPVKGNRCRDTRPDANTSRSSASKKGGKSGSYDDWSKQDLRKRAGEIGIKGRSKMSKGELVKALRDH